MDIIAQAEFPADPTTVYTMLTNREFLEEVCLAGHAVSYDVTVDGSRTISTRALPAPQKLRTFTGATLTIVEDITWGDAADDGSRTGTLKLDVKGQPATASGTVALSPAPAGSTVTVTGDLTVNLPLVGRKVEKTAAPAILDGIAVQERVGRDWLARQA